FFWVDECVFPTAVEWRTNASKDRMPKNVPIPWRRNGPIQFDTCSKSDKAMDSSGVPSAIERSPLDFAHEAEASGGETAAPEMPPSEESRKRSHEGIDANAPPKSLRRDHVDLRPSGSSRGGKSLAAMQLCLASNVFLSEGVPADVSDSDPLAFADAPSPHPADVAQ
nr:hypothetical protein [Tanacetum cinerariifolium]